MSTPLSTAPLLFALLFILAAPGVAPLVGAATPCVDRAIATLDDQHLYVRAPRAQLWDEVNGLDGLQTTSCTMHGTTYPPDTLESELPPSELGILGLCNFIAVRQCV